MVGNNVITYSLFLFPRLQQVSATDSISACAARIRLRPCRSATIH